jgi:hypothetical protein|tara:strand:+ start:1186 stop:1461 length:276 start_codon:yes stop_codon:yes gene_type:complete
MSLALEEEADFFAHDVYWKEGYEELSDCYVRFYDPDTNCWVGSCLGVEFLKRYPDYRVCDGYSHNVISSFKENGDWVKIPDICEEFGGEDL